MADRIRTYTDTLEIVEKEIKAVNRKGELDDKCLDYLDKLVDIAKDIETVLAMHDYQDEENGGYSNRMYYPHYYDNEMMNGNSYRNGYGVNRMRYSRDNDYHMNDNMHNGNGYSRTENLRMRLENMMNSEDRTETEREALRNAINRL